MGLFDWLFGKKEESNSTIFTNKEIEDSGACPNCWGKQEYDGKFVVYVEDQTKSNINHNKQGQKAFVQQFIETEITGIQLKNGSCPVCSQSN